MTNINTNFYLNKYQFSSQEISSQPTQDLNLVVVIPSFKEPHLITSLESLLACELPKRAVEVIVMMNCSEVASSEIKEFSEQSFLQASNWATEHSTERLKFHIIKNFNLPKKHAGVGLARKIGMDEAVRRLELANNPEGVIVCFDADSKTMPNYFVEIESHFQNNKKTHGCSIHYEHPLNGELEEIHYTGIINYEMHLRYYIHALKFAKYSHAHQTIGSSMAARSSVYQKQGGMNRRKAGEDFYFLHKIIPLGDFSEITTTNTIPSPRQSDRVPFGTGKAIGDYIQEQNHVDYPTYSFSCFIDLKEFLTDVASFYKNDKIDLSIYPESIRTFMVNNDFDKNIIEISRQSTNEKTFINRFFRWFDGLKVLKYVHYARDEYYPNKDVKEAVLDWNKHSQSLDIKETTSKTEILLQQRLLDKGVIK